MSMVTPRGYSCGVAASSNPGLRAYSLDARARKFAGLLAELPRLQGWLGLVDGLSTRQRRNRCWATDSGSILPPASIKICVFISPCGALYRIRDAGLLAVTLITHQRQPIVEEISHESLFPFAPLRLNPRYFSVRSLFWSVERTKAARFTRRESANSQRVSQGRRASQAIHLQGWAIGAVAAALHYPCCWRRGRQRRRLLPEDRQVRQEPMGHSVPAP